jgi:hypothetical protein
VWLGRADPAAALDKARDESPELADTIDVIDAWEAEIGRDVEITTSRLIARAGTEVEAALDSHRGALREALLVVAGQRGVIDPDRLGKWLRDNQGVVVVGNRRLERSKGKTQGRPRWVLRGI